MFISGIFGFFIFFGVAEYFRSWSYYKFYWNQNFISFITNRLLLYYSTAWNNGVVYLENHHQYTNFPTIFLESLVQLPILNQLLPTSFSSFGWSNILKYSVGTSEFNNVNPILALVADLSTVGAVVFLFGVSVLFGQVYFKAIAGDFTTRILYCILFVTLFDLPRVYWWTTPRIVPVYIAVYFIHSRLRKEEITPNKRKMK